MKRLLVASAISFLAFIATSGYARSNYVVIGAFRNETNAIHFTESARQNHMDANYTLNKFRKLFYVHVMHTSDVQKAVDEVLKLRANTEYTGAWVYHGVLGDEQEQDGIEIKTPAQTDAGASIEVPTRAEEDKTANIGEERKVEAPPARVVEVKAKVPDAGVATDPAAPTKLFFFKIFTMNGLPHEGTVELVDVDRQKKVAGSFKGNEPVVVKPINASGDMRFDCQVTGYRGVTQTINFKNPVAEAGIQIEDNQIVIPFELVRLKKGDKSVLYNVYFYKDAAIMRPESKYELDGIHAMMMENPAYRIMFHGHTNGKSSGKIIQMGESRNYFSLTGTKEGFGSAKQLSEERAIVIREYMISEGITPDRMEIKAWGGKKPIYKKDHPQAGQNVRVEIEILQD